MRHPVFAAVMGRVPASIIDAAQVINIGIGLVYIACAALDWHTRATKFSEKGSPPPVRLWAEVAIDAPGMANGFVIVLGVCCVACAFGSLRCDRMNLNMICSHCGYPATATPPCPECGRNRATRAGDVAVRRWALCSAIGLLVVTWAVGLADVVDSVFDAIRWLTGAEYAGRPLSQWPLGLGLGTVPAVLLWTMLTLLAVMECVAVRRTSR